MTTLKKELIYTKALEQELELIQELLEAEILRGNFGLNSAIYEARNKVKKMIADIEKA